jgi:tetratricopeptide (TPR) repeat protein
MVWGGTNSMAQRKSNSMLEQARKLVQEGRYSEARKVLEVEIRQRPGWPEGLEILANIDLEEDNFETATRRVLQILQARPQSPTLLTTYGFCLLRQGDFEKAEVQFRKSLKLSPTLAASHLGLGRIHLSELKTGEGLQALQEVMRLAPQLPDSYFYASEAYGSLHDLPGQINSLEKYLSLEPKSRPERVQNAKALLGFFQNLKKEGIEEIEDKDRSYELTIQPFYGLMLVEGRVNGEGPFRLLVDTGATSTVISDKLLEQLNIPSIASTVTHCVGGDGRISTQLCKLSSLEIGDLKLTNLPVSSFDNAIFAGLIDGVLSTSTLSQFLITLDYPEQKIFLNPRPASLVPQKNSTLLQSKFRVLGNLILAPVSINGQPPRNFLFDTGAVTSTLSKRQASSLGVQENTPNSKVDIQFAGACGVTKSVLSVSEVTLGFAGQKSKYAQILAVDLQEISKELQTEVAGILGGDFFSKFRVTLDYPNTALTLE